MIFVVSLEDLWIFAAKKCVNHGAHHESFHFKRLITTLIYSLGRTKEREKKNNEHSWNKINNICDVSNQH